MQKSVKFCCNFSDQETDNCTNINFGTRHLSGHQKQQVKNDQFPFHSAMIPFGPYNRHMDEFPLFSFQWSSAQRQLFFSSAYPSQHKAPDSGEGGMADLFERSSRQRAKMTDENPSAPGKTLNN
jgi:hypothetical protein